MKSVVLLIITSILLTACNSSRAKIGNTLSDASAHITCYSGGKIIYDGNSEGKPFSEKGSDGYFFRDSSTRKLMEVSGQCVINYGD